MSRNLSLSMLVNIYNQNSDDPIYVLLTCARADDPGDILRLVLKSTDLVSRGETYTAFPFDISVPDDSADQPPQASLTISNVDRRLTEFLESSLSPITVSIEIVQGSDPDTVEAAWTDLTLRNVKYNQGSAAGQLTYEKLASEGYPKGLFTPAYFQGMF
ncbi:MAG: DUF1833 domain-containing protein [Deltaproteobacteria bacterium]|nr:DUF1833 domain-containing protein [Deltaproteobacteria bacterium]